MFLRRFFREAGWSQHCIRVEKSSKGEGSGEQWVRERFPRELESARKRSGSGVWLIVMLDADIGTVADRAKALDKACVASNISKRRSGDPVMIFIPKRNIETWISYLNGEQIDEETVYRKLSRPRDCASQVRTLKIMCDAGALQDARPPSLRSACEEYAQKSRQML